MVTNVKTPAYIWEKFFSSKTYGPIDLACSFLKGRPINFVQEKLIPIRIWILWIILVVSNGRYGNNCSPSQNYSPIDFTSYLPCSFLKGRSVNFVQEMLTLILAIQIWILQFILVYNGRYGTNSSPPKLNPIDFKVGIHM